MKEDIVKRLRTVADLWRDTFTSEKNLRNVSDDAADEIERLRDENAELRARLSWFEAQADCEQAY